MRRRSSPIRSAGLLLVLSLLATACSSVSQQDLAERYGGGTNDAGVASTLPALEPSDTPTTDGRPVRSTPLQPSWGACPFDEDEIEVECGRITVPSDDPAVDDIQIAFARFNAERNVADDAVVYLHGGPGGSVLADANWLYTVLVEPFIAERDVIIYDQRGAGESSPLPLCTEAWELDPAFFGQATPHRELRDDYQEALAVCARRIQRQSDLDLSAYGSAVHADDLVDLVRALDYRKVNLYGVSYGSRLAQTVLRDHPEFVRSAILSGVYPIEDNLIGSTPAAFEQAMLEIFAACEADPGCDELLPDPVATLEAWVDRLDIEPAVVPLPWDDQSSFSFNLAGDDLLNILHGLLYSADGASLIPDLLIDLEAGDRDRLERLAVAGFSDPSDVAGYLGAQCREEVPFTSPADRALAEQQTTMWDRINLPPGLLGGDLIEACQPWTEIGTADPIENEPADWPQPTLVMSGAFDPITPPEWGEALAARLPNATFAFATDRGHDADEGPCAVELMSSFVDDPTAALDLSCLDDTDRLTLTNTNVTVIDRNDPKLEDSIFDIDPTDDVEWVDMRLPTWPADYYAVEEAYWRNVDMYDGTVIVVRAGPFDPEELTFYLPFEVTGNDFEVTAPPADAPPGWERRVFETDGMDIVSYVSTTSTDMNVSVVARDTDLAELEQRALLPMINSVDLS